MSQRIPKLNIPNITISSSCQKEILFTFMALLRSLMTRGDYELLWKELLKYGSWKDLCQSYEVFCRFASHKYSNLNTNDLRNADTEIKLFAEEIEKNKQETISLAAKWVPNEKSHYDHHPIFMFQKICRYLKWTPKQLRQEIVRQRSVLGITETFLSNDKFDQLDFSKVPYHSMKLHRNMFLREENALGHKTPEHTKLSLEFEEFVFNRNYAKKHIELKESKTDPMELLCKCIEENGDFSLIEDQWNSYVAHIKQLGTFQSDSIAYIDISTHLSNYDNSKQYAFYLAVALLIAECTKVYILKNKVFPFECSTLKEKINCIQKMELFNYQSTMNINQLIKLNASKIYILSNQEPPKEFKSEIDVVWIKLDCANLSSKVTKDNHFTHIDNCNKKVFMDLIENKEITEEGKMTEILSRYRIPIQLLCCKLDFDSFHYADKLEEYIKKSKIRPHHN